MSDLIDRQKAIDAIDSAAKNWNISEPYHEGVRAGYKNSARLILSLPSAYPERCECCKTLSKTQLLIPQPEQKWIPCSERLPEIGQSVLLSVGGMYSAEGCLREDGDWAQFRWDAIQRKDMVGAWKPLPEPYKGEQE